MRGLPGAWLPASVTQPQRRPDPTHMSTAA